MYYVLQFFCDAQSQIYWSYRILNVDLNSNWNVLTIKGQYKVYNINR